LSRFGQTLFSVDKIFFPQTELSISIFWQNTTYWSKRYPFSTAFKLRCKKTFVTGKSSRVISYRGSRLSALRVDWGLMKNSIADAADLLPLSSH
jgi:hypothetical protein